MKFQHAISILLLLVVCDGFVFAQPTDEQLARWLKRFPEADANGDGRLTLEEADAYRRKRQQARGRRAPDGRGTPRQFRIDPGWDEQRFPAHAVCYLSPDEIAATYARVQEGNRNPVVRYPKPTDGSLRIVGTGHSFMAPGYKTFPLIARAAGLKQPPPLTHTGGGMTGSARYKWEQENGIFQFDRNPTPKLLASIANAEWDAMMWGPYFNDRADFYTCWIDFCLKYNPAMKFYLSDAWPQLDQLDKIPTSPEELTVDIFVRMGQEKNAIYGKLVGELNDAYPGKVFIMPTSDAMVLAVQYFHRGQLPGVEGVHALVEGKERCLWRDRLGHLGPGFGQLEGYVFYATIYRRSPELIEGDIRFGDATDYPSPKLDRVFRQIAWQAVTNNPLSGVTDKDGDGLGD
jgi:hypothetical protein